MCCRSFILRACSLGLYCALALAIISIHSVYADDDRASSASANRSDSLIRIEAFPTHIRLTDSSSSSQLVITGWTSQDQPVDLTHSCKFECQDSALVKQVGGRLTPLKNGASILKVSFEDLSVDVPIEVSNCELAKPVDFESDLLVALSKRNCNSGACHGSPSGKGGFRLSLRAFDAALDAETIVREDYGRRVNLIEPSNSLLVQKPLMKLSHGGGQLITESHPITELLLRWIAEGASTQLDSIPRIQSIAVYPKSKRILRAPNRSQQLSVIATFDDGSHRDYTTLASYTSSNSAAVSVSDSGLVTASRAAESTILVRVLEHVETVPLLFIDPQDDLQWPDVPQLNPIDQLVDSKLRQLNITPSPLCTDSEFLRRVSLDITGQLPSIELTKSFLADTNSDKRVRLINELLDSSDYAKFWALKWGDWLRITSKRIGEDSVFKYYRWIEHTLASNISYSEFAQALLSASGSTLSNPPANYYRAANDMHDCVETFSQVFLGSRMQCAKCHNHPFERWTQDNYYGLAAFFDRVQRKTSARPGEYFVWYANKGEVVQPRTNKTMQPWLPGIGSRPVADDADRRSILIDWLVSKDNPFFARVEVNRIWGELFARGIVDPVDDFRESNPASNVELLDWLSEDFKQSGFDRKHLIRTIMSSRTYQSSCETTDRNRDDQAYFSHQVPRLLGAEQLLDAIDSVTGVEEPLGDLPQHFKATQLPAPDLAKVDFLKVFGQPERSTVCACERTSESNLGMAIEFFNGSLIQKKLRDEKNRFRTAIQTGLNDAEILDELYLRAVCRRPNKEEIDIALKQIELRGDRAQGFEDVAWALLNTDEFLFQH